MFVTGLMGSFTCLVNVRSMYVPRPSIPPLTLTLTQGARIGLELGCRVNVSFSESHCSKLSSKYVDRSTADPKMSKYQDVQFF